MNFEGSLHIDSSLPFVFSSHHPSLETKSCLKSQNRKIEKGKPLYIGPTFPDPPGYTEIEQFRKSLTPSFSDAHGLEKDGIDGLKPWSNIKYAFEKIEGSGFKCKICGQIKKHVRNHFLKHFPEHHECQLCRRTYTRKDNLNSHLKRDHFQRVKSASEPFQRLKRPGVKEPVYPDLKCFTPDVYSHVRSSSKNLSLLGGPGPMSAQPMPLQGPVDLSLRSTSVPLHAQNPCGPIYDFFPSLYNMFRN